MSILDDQQFLQLYRKYSEAIKSLDIAIQDRRRRYNQMIVRRTPVIQALEAWERRPVGSPLGTHVTGETSPGQPPGAPRKPQQLYLGPILGWATIVGTDMKSPPPEPSYDYDRLYGMPSVRFYWRAKAHYEACKREFFDYARRGNIDLHAQRATDALKRGVDLQYLGDDSDDFMEEARNEVEAVCRNVWALYQSSGSPASTDAIVLLLQWVANTQFVGLESDLVNRMQSEVDRLVSTDRIGLDRKSP